jgi:hypothetical protein
LELIPLLWPSSIYTEDTPSAEILIERIRELLLKKQGRERVENLQEVIERLEKNEEEYRKEINDKDNEIIKLNREN